jgi:hypothetical protein
MIEVVTMSNGARHGLGLLAGLILTPVIGAGVMYAALTGRVAGGLGSIADGRAPGLAVLGASVVLIAVLVGSRISPLASLIPGLGFTALALAWLAVPGWSSDDVARLVPPAVGGGAQSAAGAEMVLGVLGGVMLVASLFPSRWRARAGKAALTHAAPRAPQGAPGHVRPLPPGQPPAASGYPPPPAPVPPRASAPPASAPPASAPATPPAAAQKAAPAPAPAPAPAAAPQESPGVGEWTRMYGGDDLKDSARGGS